VLRQVLADAVVDDDRIGDRVADDGQQRRHGGERDLPLGEDHRAERDPTSWIRRRSRPARSDVEPEGDVRHDEQDRDQHALDRRVAELGAGAGPDPLGPERVLGDLVRAELTPHRVHELIALGLQIELDLVVALAHDHPGFHPGPQLEAAHALELLADASRSGATS